MFEELYKDFFSHFPLFLFPLAFICFASLLISIQFNSSHISPFVALCFLGGPRTSCHPSLARSSFLTTCDTSYTWLFLFRIVLISLDFSHRLARWLGGWWLLFLLSPVFCLLSVRFLHFCTLLHFRFCNFSAFPLTLPLFVVVVSVSVAAP